MPNIQTDLQIAEMRRQGQTFNAIASHFNLPISTVRHAMRRGNIALGIATPAPTTRTQSRRIGSLIVSDFQGYEISDRFTFGVEIECVGLSVTGAFNALQNAGVDVRNMGYTHDVISQWKVVYDGSLRGRNGSCEVVSPVLRGRDGLKEIANVEKILKNAGASINVSCGQHIHIGMDGIVSRPVQAAVILNYAKFQTAFNSLVPMSRFGNTYCKTRSYVRAQEVADMWATGANADRDRYYSLNVMSFAKYGTFEFRQHSGCLNGQRIAAYIVLHVAFIQQIENEIEGNYSTTVLTHTTPEQIAEMEMNHVTANPTDRVLNKRGVAVFHALIETMRNNMDTDAVTYLLARSGNVGMRESTSVNAI